MINERAWPQQCWKSCANGSNIVALRFGDHGTKEMMGVVSWKVWLVSSFAQQYVTTSNNMQQGVQTDATCNIQQCWELLANNVASVCTGPKTKTWLWIFKGKSLQLLLLKFRWKNCQCVEEMCSFYNPLFYTEFFAYLDKKIQTEF